MIFQLNIGVQERKIMVYEFNEASSAIIKFMFHNMRDSQQSGARSLAFQKIKNCSQKAVLIRDWAQKITEKRHLEAQSQYFAKKGMSAHIDVFFYVKNQILKKKVYITCISRCDQTMEDVLDIGRYVIAEFKKDCPQIQQLIAKSDNAGCYASNGYMIYFSIS